MGVTGLWSLLEKVKEDVSLSECNGQRIAVDLSGWIVQCSLASNATFNRDGMPPQSYLTNRGLFFRALNLSKLGITLVFVIDGPQAPIRKGKYNRGAFFQECQQFKKLLSALGFLVLEAKGEAEKLCAELNLKKLVDGVLTSDGDALVYGAQVVYTGMITDKKEQKAAKYTMAKINSVLHMNQRDLVAFALLSKGDISNGVHSVGEKKFVELLKEFKSNGIQDSLERLKSWGSNEELCRLDEQSNELHEKCKTKSRHCKLCGHEGARDQHSKTGCSVCKKENGCLTKQQAAESKAFCMCIYCPVERAVRSHTHELKIRQLALKQDINFPPQDIVDEFLSPCNTLPEPNEICMMVPNYKDVYGVLYEKLNFSQVDAAKFLIPWTVTMAVHGILPDITVEPLEILKRCTQHFIKCYTIKWAKLGFDTLSEETNSFYEFNMPTSLFARKYPEMASTFEKAQSSQKGKRKFALDPNQRKLSDMFKVVKKSGGKSGSAVTAEPDVAAAEMPLNPP